MYRVLYTDSTNHSSTVKKSTYETTTCKPRLQPESLTRHSHLSYPTPLSQIQETKPKDGGKRKKEKRPQNKKKRGIKKGEREQRLPLHQMNEIISELLLPASYPSNPHKQQITSSRQRIIKYVLHGSILPQVAKTKSCDLMPRPHELFCGKW